VFHIDIVWLKFLFRGGRFMSKLTQTGIFRECGWTFIAYIDSTLIICNEWCMHKCLVAKRDGKGNEEWREITDAFLSYSRKRSQRLWFRQTLVGYHSYSHCVQVKMLMVTILPIENPAVCVCARVCVCERESRWLIKHVVDVMLSHPSCVITGESSLD